MKIRKEYNRNHGKWFLRKCIEAITTYQMFSRGEPVCVALSGGKDSAVLLYILWYLNRFAGFSSPLYAAHIKTAAYDTALLQEMCDALGVSYLEGEIEQQAAGEEERMCYLCARLKRGALKRLAEEHDIFTVAYGHHADDVAETFFMNITHGAKLGSFSPVVGVEGSRMRIIRPMIYLREQTIRAVHGYLGLPLLSYQCPSEPESMRVRLKENMSHLDEIFMTSDFVDKLVRALENVDESNHWPDLMTGRK